MNRVRLFAIATTLLFAITMFAQQATTPADNGQEHHAGAAHGNGMPTADDHLKILSQKLDLTADQQVKIKPALQDLQDASQKLMQNSSLSHDEKLAGMRAEREKADKKIREVLNDEQKKKLDELEQGSHPELHGKMHG